MKIEKINIPEINFVKKNMNYTFNLNNSDIWMIIGNYIYLMIVQKQYYTDIWILGKPFFKKYNLIFEYDNKQIGLYTKIINENNKNNNFIYVLIIIGLIIVIIVLIFVLYKCYMMYPRKKRANEMIDDDYVYIENLINMQ